MFFNKKDYWSYFEEGESKYDSDDYEGAIEDFTKSIEKKSDYEKSYFYRAESKFQLEDYEESINDFTKAIEIRSEYADAYFGRAKCKVQLDDYEGAIEDFTKSIEIRFEFIDAYCNRGLCKAELDDYEGFSTDFNKAIELANSYSSKEELDSLYGEYYYTKAMFKEKKNDLLGVKSNLNLAVSYGNDEAKEALLKIEELKIKDY